MPLADMRFLWAMLVVVAPSEASELPASYTFFDTPKSWTDALEACQALGGTLAEPRDLRRR